ncbi:hypothetical protein ECC1470_09644, partial [Escherichia coli ECC-1470]
INLLYFSLLAVYLHRLNLELSLKIKNILLLFITSHHSTRIYGVYSKAVKSVLQEKAK